MTDELTDHTSVDGIRTDEGGWRSAECTCGWSCPPMTSSEDVLDQMMDHVARAVAEEIDKR